MIRIELSKEECQRLAEAHDASAEPKFRLRARVVLMPHRGRPRPQIVQDNHVAQRTVQRWR